MHCYCVERHHPGLLCFDFFDGCSGKALSSGFLLMIPRAGVASMAVLFSFEI
uniref:Uncharacterized protein n=1 Tax=Physcomitrium patens TaxID=3218 RepID=A0A2K1L9I9_PHYPA|nr:hypothetical protein PHYPA_001124 [Physcomitrium patens]